MLVKYPVQDVLLTWLSMSVLSVTVEPAQAKILTSVLILQNQKSVRTFERPKTLCDDFIEYID